MAIKSAFPDVFIPDESLAEFVFDKARDYGDRTALVNGTTEEIVTYSQFRQYVIAIGSGLLRHGVKQGDIVAMYSTNSPEFAMMFFGALAMGATVTMVNPLYTADELERQLNDSTASFIFTNSELSHNVRKAVKQIPTMKAIFSLGLCEGFIAFQSLCEDDGSLLDAPRHMPSSSVAVLPYSSGTTGLSKGVMLTHRNLVGNILQYSYNQFAVDPKPHADVMLGLLPFFHSFGMTATMCVGMALGVKVVTMAKYEPQRMLYLVEKYKITILQAVPPIVLFLAKSEIVSKYNLSSLRVIQSGAAPLGSDTEQEVMKRLPTCVVIQGYGLTETSPACFMAPKNLIKPGSIGVLCPNTEAKIVDPETRSTVGPGVEGEVCLRGSQIMKGYFNNTVATAASIDTDGWFSTGDLGYYDDDKYFFIVDRLKELIKFKGYQVAPAELEALLVAHPSIEDAAVIGVPHEEEGEYPKAYVVLKPGHVVSKPDIITHVNSKLAPFKHIRAGVEFLREIPKSNSGKILRRKLRVHAKKQLQSKL